MAENMHFAPWSLIYSTAFTAMVTTSSLLFLIVCILWMSEVDTNVCIISTLQSMQASRSFVRTRARPQTSRLRPSLAMALTFCLSPSEETGKPASSTSTPSLSSCRAILSFCSLVSDTPGVCSPSRSVVSKIVLCVFISGLSL